MVTRAARSFRSLRGTLCAAVVLLPLAGTAAAQQAWPSERVDPPKALSEFEQPVAWPQAPADAATETFFGIRHNNTDGTVVGMGLRPGSFPEFLLELEVVPPGYGPATDAHDKPTPSLPVNKPELRNLHKLTLRYHF